MTDDAWTDARLPVWLVADGVPADRAATTLVVAPRRHAAGHALARVDLPEAAPAPGHPASCSCCVPRGGLASLLAEAFRQRARGAMPFFTSVHIVAGVGRREDVQTALREDRVLAARFRLVAAEVEPQ